ncbi:hypothetical protein [Burkholderia ambifaria]|uniref:hypothetical protein n=1 Tax=Burkholderia ambifaria TaxID=152480 RepID=UPI0011B27EB9|nr:hypothetical protein [Burkholderia ambifaria]
MLAAVDARLRQAGEISKNWMFHYRFDFYLGIFSKCRGGEFGFYLAITMVVLFSMPIESFIEDGGATFSGGEAA